MLKRFALAGTMAAMCAGVAVGAQTPATGAEQSPAQEPRPTEQTAPRASESRGSTTLTGCVYREQDVAGRTPNVAERAGILEDYILADVKTGDTASAATPSAAPGSTEPGAVGTSGAAAGRHSMYKLEHADDERLKAMVGKRVEVTGRIDAETGDTAARPSASAPSADRDKSVGPDKIELAEFEVTSIREVEGSCAASPGASR